MIYMFHFKVGNNLHILTQQKYSMVRLGNLKKDQPFLPHSSFTASIALMILTLLLLVEEMGVVTTDTFISMIWNSVLGFKWIIS